LLLVQKRSCKINSHSHFSQSRALFYEKGDVLRSFVFALLKYEISFTEMQSKYPLDSLICDLLSARPHACSDTMDMFSDLRDVFINLVCKSFRAFILKTRDLNETEKLWT